ncbi:hypothetical protein KSP39_PZI017200 [Platanthera zijinensis]|uniref:Uncharacterized protein n=1 Tax=Platanthera zijinensis TaxID=2320716 RepID=A0AAP0B4Y4_9ASPA
MQPCTVPLRDWSMSLASSCSIDRTTATITALTSVQPAVALTSTVNMEQYIGHVTQENIIHHMHPEGMPTQSGHQSHSNDCVFPEWVKEIYRGHVVNDKIAWHDMPHIYKYNGPKILILKVPRDISVIEQWDFVFRAFATSKTMIVPKS